MYVSLFNIFVYLDSYLSDKVALLVQQGVGALDLGRRALGRRALGRKALGR